MSHKKVIYRDGEVIPYDHARVVLTEPIKGCNYINASWIADIDSAIGEHDFEDQGSKIIVAQAPMEDTMLHFLQMLVEQSDH